MIIKRADIGILIAMALAVILIPLAGSDYWVFTMGTVAAVSLAVIGLNVALGWTALLTFAQVVFMAIGGYTSAILTTRYHINPWLAVVIGCAFAIIVAVAVGIPILRLEDHYFAVCTFAMSLMLLSIIDGTQSYTGGAIGITNIPALRIGPVNFDNHYAYYALSWLLVAVALAVTYSVRASRTGRAFRVLAARPEVAASLGINVRRYRVIAFVISAVLASVAGSLIVEYSTYASPDNFNGDIGILVFAMLFLGGVRTASGPLIGAAVVTILPVFVTAIGNYSAILFELILLAILIILPDGLGIGVASSVEVSIERFVGQLGKPRARARR